MAHPHGKRACREPLPVRYVYICTMKSGSGVAIMLDKAINYKTTLVFMERSLIRDPLDKIPLPVWVRE